MYMVSYEKLAYYDCDRYYHSIVNDLILKNKDSCIIFCIFPSFSRIKLCGEF